MTIRTPLMVAALSWQIVVNSGAVQSDRVAKQDAPKSASADAFLAWRDAIGLTDEVSYVEEQENPTQKRHSLTVHTRQLQIATGPKIVSDLYERLFLKFVAVSQRPPEQLELRVRYFEGYCAPAERQVIVSFGRTGLVRTDALVRPRGNLLCALDFVAIRRLQTESLSTLSRVGSRAPSDTDLSLPEPLTTAAIRQDLIKRYASIGATPTVTGHTNEWLSLTVRALRGEVIKNKPYWERLQLFVFLQRIEKDTHLRLVIDGRFGAGLAAPGDYGYVDMEPQHTQALQEYGQALAQNLVESR